VGAPITKTSSRPLEGWVIGDSLEHPREIVVIICRETQFGSVLHSFRQGVESLAGHKASFLVAPLRPRVGKQDEDAINRRRREGCEQQSRVIDKNPDIVDVTVFDVREKPCDTGLEDFAADEADVGMAFGLNCKVLACAKTNL